MYDYYCKNCNNMVGTWNNIYKNYYVVNFCDRKGSKNFDSIYFLDCIYCDKFVGIKCYYVCKNCFGENEIFEEEENLFNFFLKYKKFKLKYKNFKYSCKNCNNDDFRCQYWFFEELTFYKQ